MRLASGVASPKLSLAPGIGGLLDVFSIASDLYSIVVVFYNMCCRNNPFVTDDNSSSKRIRVIIICINCSLKWPLRNINSITTNNSFLAKCKSNTSQ